jgi:hypothetical protein
VLRGLGSGVQYDKPLVGAALPRSSLDAELYHLILPSVTMTRGDVDCQFLTKKCLQLAEQEAYLEQLDYQLTLLKVRIIIIIIIVIIIVVIIIIIIIIIIFSIFHAS